MNDQPSALAAFAPRNGSSDRRLDAAIVAQAADHMAALWSGEARESQQRAIERWRAAHPDHELAWRRLEAFRHALGSLPSEAARKALLGMPAGAVTRRKALQVLGIAALGFGAMPLMRETAAWQRVSADHHTSTGQRRAILLPDGTQLLLNSGSAVDVDYGATHRRILLRAGELFVATASDPASKARPFSVHTRHGTALALGTRYLVRLEEAATRVAVFEGAVRIMPGDDPALARMLAPGERSQFSVHRAQRPEPATSADDAWIRGQLVVERMRLAEFLTELRRYRPGLLSWDESLSDLGITGVFSVDDTDLALASLAQSLPVEIRRRNRFWTQVRAR